MANPAMVAAAGRAADLAATLLTALIPPAARRAERRISEGSFSSTADHEDALRTLLVFHQDIVSPVSTAFAFALPSSKALHAICQHASAGIVEVGAGNGLWSALLRTCAPLLVHASDCAEPEQAWDDSLLCTTDGRVSTTADDPRALFLCWPSLELEAPPPGAAEERTNTMAVDALAAYSGTTLIYIGEWRGSAGVLSALSHRTADHGQTAGAAFWAVVDREWQCIECVPLPRWPGFADSLFIFRRRGQPPRIDALPSTPPATPPSRCSPCLARRLHELTTTLGLTQRPVVAAMLVLEDHLRSCKTRSTPPD